MSFYIKDLEIKKSVILAPMAGITSFSYRKFLSEFGVGATYSEMISDCGLIYNNKKTIEMMKNDSNFNRPYGIQLFGGSKESLLKGLEVIENSNIEYDFLDLNLACPVPKVTKGNGGSKWLTKLDEMYEMVKAVVEKSKKPVTAKVRLGWKSVDIEKICVLLEKAGVSLIAIHPRTRNQLYTGCARYELIKNIKEKMKIPLAISGDIFTLEQAIEYQKMTGADFIMVARGALGNPFLVTQIATYFKTGEILPSPTLKQNLNYLKEHFEKLISLKGEETATKEMRGIAPHYLKGYPNTKAIRNLLATQMKTYQDFLTIISSLNEID